MVLPQPADSPAKNTRSCKASGSVQPLKPRSANQVMPCATNKPGITGKRKAGTLSNPAEQPPSKSQAQVRREAAAARRKQLEEERCEALKAKREARGMARTGSNPQRTASGGNSECSNRRPTGGAPSQKAGGAPTQKAVLTDRLADLEKRVSQMVTSAAVTTLAPSEPAEIATSANVSLLLEKQNEVQERSDSLVAELKALEKSKASEIESLRKESETVVLQLKQKQEGEIEALKTAHTSVISTKTAEITALESSYTEAQGVHAAELEAGKKQLELATADARQLRKDLEERADQLASVRSAMETTAASLSEVQSMLDSERASALFVLLSLSNAQRA
jgi:hypothetical protein